MSKHQFDIDDSILLQRLYLKASEALAYVFHDYSKSVYFFCRAILADDTLAEDVVQDTFITLWDHKTRFRSLVSMKTFMYNTARNRCLDILKHDQVKHRHSRLAACELNEDFLEQKIMEEELISKLHHTIEQLPPECSRIFRMSLEGMKNNEIAEHLSISVNTVKTQKQRAMAILRQKFGEITPLLILIYPNFHF